MTENNSANNNAAKPANKGITRLVRAFGYSVDGLKSSFAREAAFRQEAMAALVMVPLSFFVTSDGVERALLIAVVLLVMITELLNSAIEAVVDRAGLERHPLAKHAKDAGSAAVLLALILAGIVWLAVLT